MALNEADTRAQLIDPQLNRAGWTRSQVTREHYYRPDFQFTPGRVVLRGGRAERDKPRIMDYLLRYTDSFPIAVVEAKAADVPAVAGLEQAKRYARENSLMFAYAANGRAIIEWDGFSDTTREIGEFPTPNELWLRWRINTGVDDPGHISDPAHRRTGELRPVYNAAVAAARRRNPLLYPYAPPEVTRGSSFGSWSSRNGSTSRKDDRVACCSWPTALCCATRLTTPLDPLPAATATRVSCWMASAS